MNYQEQTDNLHKEQKANWLILTQNLEGLKNALLKTFQFDGFNIKVQFNPKRITSSAAKVDKKSIEDRKCFLCSNNRPLEQNQVLFEKEYEILCNPFPIFKEHYTIASLSHTPQQIETSFGDFLDISKALPDLVTFYNAPNCGASAPDHLHFQAGNRGFLSIEDDYKMIESKYGKNINSKLEINISCINDSLRRFIVLKSENKEAIEKVFGLIYSYTKELANGDEPMLNILSWYQSSWQVMIFPRDKHRPWQFFEEGEKNILLSPASVDLGGTLITPLEKDFEKISNEDITDILNQSSMSIERFDTLINYIQEKLNK